MLDDAMIDLLRPLVRQLVRDELAREREQRRWLSARQAAAELDVSVDAIYQRVARGTLPHRKLDGRVYIDIETFYDTLGHPVP